MDRDFDVYVDSPLAIEATEVFSKNVEQCFDEDAIELVRQGINPLSFPGLKYAISSEESKMINFDTNPKVIISASGMCEAGRIRHHLKHTPGCIEINNCRTFAFKFPIVRIGFIIIYFLQKVRFI